MKKFIILLNKKSMMLQKAHENLKKNYLIVQECFSSLRRENCEDKIILKI